MRHEIRRRGKHSFLDVYASPEVIAYINTLAGKCGVIGGEFILNRKGLTIGRTYYCLKKSLYGSLLHVAPIKFYKWVMKKNFASRLARFQTQIPTLKYDASKFFDVEFKIRNKSEGEFLEVYAQPEVIEYVDYLKSDPEEGYADVFMGKSITDDKGNIVGKEYWVLEKYRCVKWETVLNQYGESEKKCVEYENRVYAPRDFVLYLKKKLTSVNISKLKKVREKLEEAKRKRYQKENALLVCVSSLEDLIEEEGRVNPLKLKPKEFNFAWVTVSKLIGVATELKRKMLAEQKRPFSFSLSGDLNLYNKLKKVPWLGDKLKRLKKYELWSTLQHKMETVLVRLEKKRNYLTSMLYLTEAEQALFKNFQNKKLDRSEKERVARKIERDLSKNLKHFLGSNLQKSFGLTLSRVFLQKYDILKENYFNW